MQSVNPGQTNPGHLVAYGRSGLRTVPWPYASGHTRLHRTAAPTDHNLGLGVCRPSVVVGVAATHQNNPR